MLKSLNKVNCAFSDTIMCYTPYIILLHKNNLVYNHNFYVATLINGPNSFIIQASSDNSATAFQIGM